MNKIIIDGYNMIHRVPELCQFLSESLERSREELIRQLKSYLLTKKVEATLIFDGNHPPIGIDPIRQSRSLKIIFSRYPFKADPLIKELIKKEQHQKSLIIVTDDSDIIQFAKTHQTKVLSTVEFYNRMMKRFQNHDIYHKFDKDLSEEELAEWLRIFGEK